MDEKMSGEEYLAQKRKAQLKLAEQLWRFVLEDELKTARFTRELNDSPKELDVVIRYLEMRLTSGVLGASRALRRFVGE